MLPKFEYVKLKSVGDSVDFLDQHGEETKILAGGTDLLVLMRGGTIKPRYLLDIKSVDEVKSIKKDKKRGLVIGAAATLNQVFESSNVNEGYRVIKDAAYLHSDYEIRNRATLAGNICNALPGADMAPPLMVLDANAILCSSKRERKVEIKNFFMGIRKTAVKSNELLKEVEIPRLPRHSGVAFMKIGRTREDLALVNCAVRITLEEDETCKTVKIAVGGGIGPTLVETKKACILLEGKEPVDDLIARTALVSSEELAPRTGSFRGSPSYKKALAKVLVHRALRAAVKRAKEKSDFEKGK